MSQTLIPNPNPNPRLLVTGVVLNYRSPKDTVRCIEALKKQTIAERMNIIVVDNHSEDESSGWFRARYGKDSSVRCIEERKNVGYGRGNNAALPFLESEFVLIINPDNVLPPDGIERMLAVLERRTDAGIVGPALVYPDGGIRPSARRFPNILDLCKKRLFPAAWQKKYEEWMNTIRLENEVEVDWLVGACLLLRTDLLRSLGGFDRRFFLFFEDIDLCRRIRLLGKRVLYLPNIHVLDRKNRLSGSSALSLLFRKMTWIHARSAMQYFWKWRA